MDADSRTHGLAGTLLEFAGGLATVLAGALGASLASEHLASPAREAAIALVVAAVAAAGLAWLRRFASNREPAWSSSLAALGGAVGYLAFEFLVGGHAPVGAGLGAALFVVAGVFWARRSRSRSG